MSDKRRTSSLWKQRNSQPSLVLQHLQAIKSLANPTCFVKIASTHFEYSRKFDFFRVWMGSKKLYRGDYINGRQKIGLGVDETTESSGHTSKNFVEATKKNH